MSRSPADGTQRRALRAVGEPEAVGEQRVVDGVADVDGHLGHVPRPGHGQRAGEVEVAEEDVGGDGDLDLVTSTVGSPAQLFVNELCGGSAILVEPRASGGNTRALGARVTVATESGLQTRTIRSGIGYLSADPAVAHFGLGDEAATWVSVEWPDGERTVVEAPEENAHLRVARS